MLAGATFVATVDLPVAFLPVIALVWGAWRFDPRTTGVQLVALSVLVTLATAHGRGPFGETSDRLSGAATTHSYLVTVAVLCLLLATYGEQRRRDVDAIDQAGHLLSELFDESVRRDARGAARGRGRRSGRTGEPVGPAHARRPGRGPAVDRGDPPG